MLIKVEKAKANFLPANLNMLNMLKVITDSLANRYPLPLFFLNKPHIQSVLKVALKNIQCTFKCKILDLLYINYKHN